MSYKTLYRTYRPQNFDEVVGQDHIVLTLKNIILQQKIGHAYLFAGPRGTGKTSVAHIFARSVNKITDINSIKELDIIEIDAASNNGVAEVRNIISNINYAPSKGQYKVYIVDEVHMLTKGAFNALLKTLEEPPVHVIFILATTEPHKIPITILSRTQRFNFRRIEENIIQKQLENVLIKENITYDQESLKFISKLSQGGMRDALSIAEQASAFGNNNITFESISQVFGIISIENQIQLLNYAYLGDSKTLMSLINKFLDNGIDIERLASSLLDITKDYIIYEKTSDNKLISFISNLEVQRLNIDINFAYKTIDILMELITNLRYTAVPRQLMELSMLKIINQEKNTIPNNEKIEKSVSNNLFKNEIDKEKKNEDDTIETIVEGIEENIENIFEYTSENIPENEESENHLKEEEKPNFQKIEVGQEVENNLNEIENDLLSTQEINLNEINSTKTSDSITQETFEEEEEEDIMKLFDTKESEFTEIISNEDVINLFSQAIRSEIESDKSNWKNIQKYIINEDYQSFVQLLIQTKIISSGKKFVLISSNEENVIDGINLERKSSKFVKFINEILGKPKLVFAINKTMFEESKNEWQILKDENNLPKTQEINVTKIEPEIKTQEEKFGEELFEEVFSVEKE